MHLKNITLRNFRCFREFSLNLHPRLTVIVAENGGGKTSILDGIAIGLTPVLRYLSSASQRLSGPGIQDTDFRVESIGSNDQVQTSNFTQIEIETQTGNKWDVWQAGVKGKEPDNKIGYKDIPAYGTKILDSFKTDNPELLPVFAYYGARRGWLPIPQRLRGTKIDYSQPTSALLGSLESLNDFKEMLNWFDIEEANELRANKGRSPETYVESDTLAAVRTALLVILGGIYKNPQFNRQHKFVVESQIGPEQIQVAQLSQGYQSMLALGMDFARRLALANRHLEPDNLFEFPGVQEFLETWNSDSIENLNSKETEIGSLSALAPAIMLVDEIDLHLHPSWQQRVLNDLMRAFPGTQFVVTTHSPQVLTTLRKENIRILACDDEDNWSAAIPDFSPLAQESGDALAAIMETYPRPEIAEINADIHVYEQLAREGKANSPEAQKIQKRLDKAGFEFTAADKSLFRYLSQKAGAEPGLTDD
jgi:predicted ATP-binding protein involved in virulence